MMKMKNLVALAVAAAVMSPMTAMADNTPDNVGNVTLLGNIVANSPMWQWTVNDYPGPSLDVHASSATTVDGVTTYKLNGQSFIAVSGYAPSFVPVISGNSIGYTEKTHLTDGAGNNIADWESKNDGKVEFTIQATSTNASGETVSGKLHLEATEIRGQRDVFKDEVKRAIIYIGTSRPLENGSCFAGVGAFDKSAISGSGTNPTSESFSPTAFAEWVKLLQLADEKGNAPHFDTYTTTHDGVVSQRYDCRIGAINSSAGGPDGRISRYAAGAHTLELSPVKLAFSAPVQGTWSATLNVTAYQM